VISHPIPVVHQRDDHDCGPACLDAVLTYAGFRPLPDQLIRLASRRHGCDAADLAGVLEAAGVPCSWTVDSDLDELAGCLLSGPVIAAMQAYGTGHWVVVVGMSRTRVTVMDPASVQRCYRWLPVTEFYRRWWDTDRRGRRVDRVAVSMRIRPRLARPVKGVPD
jgi:predicted double-glycine peptidase